MLPKIRNAFVAATAALALAVAMPAPAEALSKKDKRLLAALAAAGIVGTLIVQQNNRQRAATVTRAPSPTPVRTVPAYSGQSYPRQTFVQPRYQEVYPATRPATRQAQPAAPSGIHASPAAQAFNSYSPAERRMIQSRLANAGYYQGGIDGAFGPMTYRAIMAIAGDSTGVDQLSSVRGAYEFYDAILS